MLFPEISFGLAGWNIGFAIKDYIGGGGMPVLNMAVGFFLIGLALSQLKRLN